MPDQLESLSIPEEPTSPTNLSKETSKDSKSMSIKSSSYQEVKRFLKEDMVDLLTLLRPLINVSRVWRRLSYQSMLTVLLKRLKKSPRR